MQKSRPVRLLGQARLGDLQVLVLDIAMPPALGHGFVFREAPHLSNTMALSKTLLLSVRDARCHRSARPPASLTGSGDLHLFEPRPDVALRLGRVPECFLFFAVSNLHSEEDAA